MMVKVKNIKDFQRNSGCLIKWYFRGICHHVKRHSVFYLIVKKKDNNWQTYIILGKPFVCDVCFKGYTWKRGLMQHQQYSCGKDPQFFCPVSGCNYKARIKGNVKKHCSRIHSNKYREWDTYSENCTMFIWIWIRFIIEISYFQNIKIIACKSKSGSCKTK